MRKSWIISGAAVVVFLGVWSLNGAKNPAAAPESANWLQSEGIIAFMAVNDGLPKCSGGAKARAESVVPDAASRSISFDVSCAGKLDFGPVEMKHLTMATLCDAYEKTALAERGVALLPRLKEQGKVVSSPFRITTETCG